MALTEVKITAKNKTDGKAVATRTATAVAGSADTSTAVRAGYADTAGRADEATHASRADEATHASRADEATHASRADEATHASRADEATHASRADEATHASRADEATHASRADEATHASRADEATHASKAHDIDEDSPLWGKFLRKDVADTAREKITLKKGIEVGAYSEGLLGSGAKIDPQGNAEMQSLTLRQWLEVPELRYNRTTVHVGASFNSPAGGIIERVVPNGNGGTAYLKLEDGELGTIEVGDLLMGIYHATTSQGGATVDADNGKLDVQFSGFATCYFEVTSVGSERKSFAYTLRAGTTIHPQPFMTFASRGNKTTQSRQQFVFSTRSYTRYLQGVNSWDVHPENIVMQLGDLSNVQDTTHPNMGGIGIYCGNAYLGGEFRLKTSQKEIEAMLQDLETKVQEASLSVSITSSAGTAFRNGVGTTILTARVTQGMEDLTDRLPASSYSWSRSSANADADEVWATQHQGVKQVEVQASEIGDRSTYSVEIDMEQL